MDPEQRNDPILLSGWLFADLLLALAVIFLAMSPGAPPRKETPTPTPAKSALAPTATPALPTAVPTPSCQRSVALTKIERSTPNTMVNGQPSIPAEDQLIRTFSDLSASTVGLVNVYVRVPSPGQGQPLAREVSERLRRSMPGLFPPDAIYEPFNHVDANRSAMGGVLFQLYLLSDVCK